MYIILGIISYFAIMLVSILTVYSWIDGEKKLAATNFVLVIVFSILTIVCFTKAQEEKVKENLNQRGIKMEQFNLEEYFKNPNRKIVTRNGNDVRIICTNQMNTETPIVALIKERKNAFEDPYEVSYNYYVNGHLLCNRDDPYDIFFADEDVRKHEGWVNIYKDFDSRILSKHIYRSESDAVSVRQEEGEDYIATVKITWEE